ncbi:MAG: Ldh family oxidoreductase [Spirochaetales bacterium]|nr:Ldh family oxidoreductase [Spirochaetales bacterium]
MAEERIRVNAEKLKKLAARELESLGVPKNDAAITADVLVTADLRGVETHGIVSLVPFYIRGIQAGRINPKPDIKVSGTNLSTATVDGDKGLGYAVTYRAMKEAISRAQETGVGFVSVGNSTHFGPGFYYAMMALEYDMIGFTLTCSPVAEVVAPGSNTVSVGTNPLAIAAPANKKPPFVLDMATSVVATGKFRKAILEGKSVPEGWAIDKEGKPITDPSKRTLDNGGILPLGGTPELGEYKGFGLGVAVDILTSVLSGYAPAVLRRTKEVSHLAGALRISSFTAVDTFKNLMDEMIEAYDALPKLPGVKNIYIAGSYEAEVQKDREANGIPLLPQVIQTLKEAAGELGVEFDL